MHHILFVIIVAYLFVNSTMVSMAQNKPPVCTSLESIKSNEGKRILVFGELARHHQLPHTPYILLLENNDWIFLGNDSFFQGKIFKTRFILIEGVVQLQNSNFQLANFYNKPLPPVTFINANKQPIVEAPEKVIRLHPFVKQVFQIHQVPDCYSSKDVAKHLNQWVAVYGLIAAKTRGDKGTKVYFQTNRHNAWLQFETSKGQSAIQNRRKQPGMAIVKFTDTAQSPTTHLLQRVFPICNTARQVKEYLGQLVSISGRIKKRGKFKIKPNTYLYLYSMPLGLDSYKLRGQRIQMITRIYDYYTPQFFTLHLFYNRLAFGQIGDINGGLWYEIKP